MDSKGKVRLFLESTSIRGLGRIVRTQSTFLKYLWISFVCCTTGFLIYSVIKIILDYLRYDVNIQTSLGLDDNTHFPALTFCNQQAFSKQAYQSWDVNEILSPTAFNEKLRHMAYSSLMLNHNASLDQIKSYRYIENMGRAQSLSLPYDTQRMYYQNLAYDDATKIGHSSDIITKCLFSYGENLAVAGKACIDESINVTSFSNPNFFNCFTITFKDRLLREGKALTLIVHLGPEENYNIKYRQGFIFDIFQQAYGIRAVVHEPGTYPDIERQGIQIEPGKMNEISYLPIRNKRAQNPSNPCIEDSNSANVTYPDLKNEYQYGMEMCIYYHIQQHVAQQCNCMWIEVPRIQVPNKNLPYCGYILDGFEKFKERSRCVEIFTMENMFKLKQKFARTKCLKKCTLIEYQTTVSITKWRQTSWQLYWIEEQIRMWNNIFDTYYKNVHELSNATELEQSLASLKEQNKHIEEFLLKKNLTEIHNAFTFEFNDRYAFVMVKRKANNTIVKEERLVLTLTALLSRIGGLCSIYIGLNLAFVIELVEFIYLALCDTSKPKEKSVTSASTVSAQQNNGSTQPSSIQVIHNRRKKRRGTDATNEDEVEDEEEEICALTWENSGIKK